MAVSPPGLVPVRPRLSRRGLLTFVLAAVFAAGLIRLDLTDGVLHQRGGSAAWSLVRSLAQPDVSPDFLRTVAEAALLTMSYAVAGLSVALVIGLPGALAVSGVLARGRPVRVVTATASRGLFATLRAAHELVWALLLLAILGPTPLAGVLAIGVPYGATIARVLGERLQDVPEAPLAALRSSGASPWQVLCYGRLPMAAPDLVSYGFYRFECAVRAAAVLSFIGLGGIGYRVEIALADLRFGQVWTLLAALVVLIVAVDWMSGRLRGQVLR